MIKKIIKGILAGFLIGMAGAMFLIAKSVGFSVIPALLFPVGLFLICVFSFNLYTGKVGFLFNKEKDIKVLDLLIMVFANFIGAVLFGLIYTAIFSGNELLVNIADSVANQKFGELTFVSILLVLLKSTLCGILVYIAVYLFGKVESFGAKALAIWIPIFTFVYLGLDHSIANMFYMAAMNNYSLNAFILIIIAIIGNSIGAIIFDICLRFINDKEEHSS